MSYIYYIRVGNTLADHEYFSIHLFGENYIYPDLEKVRRNRNINQQQI